MKYYRQGNHQCQTYDKVEPIFMQNTNFRPRTYLFQWNLGWLTVRFRNTWLTIVRVIFVQKSTRTKNSILSNASQSLNVFDQLSVVFLVIDRWDVHDHDFVARRILERGEPIHWQSCISRHRAIAELFSNSYPVIFELGTHLENKTFEENLRNHLFQLLLVVVKGATNLFWRTSQQFFTLIWEHRHPPIGRPVCNACLRMVETENQ